MTVAEPHALVVGAGVGGLGAALALSRAGARVTLVERDATPLPADPDAAFAWDRRGAPQVRHSHALLARLRNLLRDEYRDVLDALLEAGATEIRFCEMLPEEITDRAPRPGDEDLVALACRRTTFEWVLRRTVLQATGVELRHGVDVDGLHLLPGTVDDAVRVGGVRLHDGTIIEADLVVTALGRRSAVPRWLTEVGVEVDEVEEETGIVYLSRFYRLNEGQQFPDAAGPIGGDLGYLKYGVFQGDNRTFSVTLALRTHDDELRALVLDPETFDRAACALTATREWLAPGRALPVTPVHAMGGLLNRSVVYAGEDGSPIVWGLHAVGDAHTCTNPLYGRGCSLAMVQAHLLAQALLEHGLEHGERGRAYEQACEREILPWYKAALHQDRMARQLARREQEAPGAETDAAGDDPAAFMQEVMREGLLPAVRSDASVFRSFIRAFNLLDPPDAMLTDADVFTKVLTAYQDREHRPPQPSLGPPRVDMLAILMQDPIAGR